MSRPMISARPSARWSLASGLAVITLAGSMAISAPAANAAPAKSNCFGAPAIFATTGADCAQQLQAQVDAILQALAVGDTDEADLALQVLLAAAGAGDTDLQLIMDVVKAQMASKQGLRDVIALIAADWLANVLQNACAALPGGRMPNSTLTSEVRIEIGTCSILLKGSHSAAG